MLTKFKSLTLLTAATATLICAATAAMAGGVESGTAKLATLVPPATTVTVASSAVTGPGVIQSIVSVHNIVFAEVKFVDGNHVNVRIENYGFRVGERVVVTERDGEPTLQIAKNY